MAGCGRPWLRQHGSDHVTEARTGGGTSGLPFPWYQPTRADTQQHTGIIMREIVHIQAGQCGNQIGAKVSFLILSFIFCWEIAMYSFIFLLSVSVIVSVLRITGATVRSFYWKPYLKIDLLQKAAEFQRWSSKAPPWNCYKIPSYFTEIKTWLETNTDTERPWFPDTRRSLSVGGAKNSYNLFIMDQLERIQLDIQFFTLFYISPEYITRWNSWWEGQTVIFRVENVKNRPDCI